MKMVKIGKMFKAFGEAVIAIGTVLGITLGLVAFLVSPKAGEPLLRILDIFMLMVGVFWTIGLLLIVIGGTIEKHYREVLSGNK